jgi:nitrous oxidase accessory protein NosD
LINIHACGATSEFRSGYGIGINLGNGGFPSSHITLKGGVVCRNPSHGIALSYLDQGMVTGVHVYGNGGDGIILYYNRSAPDTNNSVTDNIVSGNKGAPISDSGSNTILNCNRPALDAPCSTNALVSQLSEAVTSGSPPGCTSTGFSSRSYYGINVGCGGI